MGCQEGGCWRFLTGDMEDKVILGIRDDLCRPQGTYPESFRPSSEFLSEIWQFWSKCLTRVVERVVERVPAWLGGVKKGGAWRTLGVPDRTNGGQGHSWRHEWCFFTPRKIPWKFCVDISIRGMAGRGVQKGGPWRTLRVPDRTYGGHDHSCHHEWCFLPQRIYPKNFMLISQLEVCQEGGV